MNILLLSAYDAHSHASWRKGLVNAFPEFSFKQLVLPPRFFSWRIRGNSLSFAASLEADSSHYDLLIATSMVDLSTLFGIAPKLRSIPSLLYFHENQFAFPSSDNAHTSIEPQMVNLFSALSATKLCFNTQFNFDSFLSGLRALLKRFPDEVPENLEQTIFEKSSVLPVPLLDDVFLNDVQSKHSKCLSVVWNHRWEYDKGPNRLLRFIKQLPSGLGIEFNIVGQRFRKTPSEMELVEAELVSKGYLGHYGPIACREDYLAMLSRSNIVLSTAIHDFQGLSVLEAMAMGCVPLVPDRLAYQEHINAEFRYESRLDDVQSEAESAVHRLLSVKEKYFSHPDTSVASEQLKVANNFSWAKQKPNYYEVIKSLV